MEKSEILEKLKDILRLAGTCTDEAIDGCNESSDLNTDLGLTSVGVLYVVIAIEEMFAIRFGDVGFADFRTVGDVISYIQNEQQV